jgi:hypothetical protein
LESELPTLVKGDASVFVPNTNCDWLRAIADVLGVVVVEFAVFVGISDSCEERDAMEKEEFIADRHSGSCFMLKQESESNFIQAVYVLYDPL